MGEFGVTEIFQLKVRPPDLDVIASGGLAVGGMHRRCLRQPTPDVASSQSLVVEQDEREGLMMVKIVDEPPHSTEPVLLRAGGIIDTADGEYFNAVTRDRRAPQSLEQNGEDGLLGFALDEQH